jgi:hypothetical protein
MTELKEQKPNYLYFSQDFFRDSISKINDENMARPTLYQPPYQQGARLDPFLVCRQMASFLPGQSSSQPA